jgi:hypothetical protein
MQNWRQEVKVEHFTPRAHAPILKGAPPSGRAGQTAPHVGRLLPLLMGALNRHDRKVVQQRLSGTEGVQIIQASTNQCFRGQLRSLRQEIHQAVLAIFFVRARPGFRDTVRVQKQGFAGS